jgi:glycolate oxidase
MKKQTVNQPYEIDASQIKGKATQVFNPTTVEEIETIVRAHPHICIRGGGSGLVGGAVPQDEVVLDLSKLDKIGEIDLNRKIVEVEAGVILDELQEALLSENLEFPINPSSHAIATIGGMISTDAVGSRAVKYGRTSEWVNWIEVVDCDGKVLKKSQTELSDYAGMEGISGVIVRASLKLTPRKERSASLIVCESLKEVHDSVLMYKPKQDVSMIEFLDKKISSLIGLGERYILIVEYENQEGELRGKEYRELMAKRDSAYPLLAEKDYTIIEDPKIMLGKFEGLMNWFEKNEIPVFGHLSVGILHPCFKKNQKNLIDELLRYIPKISGKISGEHGIGLIKKQYVDINDKKIILNIKKRTDPKNKFNQGKIL